MPLMQETQPVIGFIGQGFVGKNMADDFETRGFTTVRYALEEPYRGNKERIAECAVVFIAVPTPTTPAGHDTSIIVHALPLVGQGKTAVIKSTVLPGSTESFQAAFPDRIILFCPEFLSEATAAHDAQNPFMNIIGTAENTLRAHEAAERVMEVLPRAAHTQITTARAAELIKYAHNTSGYVQIVYVNALYTLAEKLGIAWEEIQKAMEADPFIPNRYCKPLHKSGRGAGGHCFVKDFAAFRDLFVREANDSYGAALLRALEEMNLHLLKQSGKDKEIIDGVYGAADTER